LKKAKYRTYAVGNLITVGLNKDINTQKGGKNGSIY